MKRALAAATVAVLLVGCASKPQGTESAGSPTATQLASSSASSSGLPGSPTATQPASSSASSSGLPVSPSPPSASSTGSQRTPSTSSTASQRTPLASPTASQRTPAVVSCEKLAAGLSPQARLGQLFMLKVDSFGLDGGTAKLIQQQQLGSVVLLGNSKAGVDAIKKLTDKVKALAKPELPILVAVDQEGGTVQRLAGPGFSKIPSALAQGKLTADELQADAKQWGSELADAGVRFNLAPVADLVPVGKQQTNAPIGKLRRNFGNDVQTVSAGVRAVVAGMKQARVATSLKHFPGLGQVVGNTDFGYVLDRDVSAGDANWESFKAGIKAGASSVMISSAVYTKLDAAQQAVFSKPIVTGLLREKLGFDKVVISDDLGAAAAVAKVAPAERGVRFLAAGGDLVINADPSIQAEMLRGVRNKADADPQFRARVSQSAARVLALKAELGLLDCAAN